MSAKHIPQRTCVGCREVLPKRSLTRIVRLADGVMIDPTSKAPGRGAYLHDRRACWDLGLKGSLARALRVGISGADQEKLMEYMDQLPDKSDG